MVAINRIDLRLRTADEDRAGTDSDVYMGICGREFFVDSQGGYNDFEKGDDKLYTFGVSANVRYENYNDPRSPQLDTEDLDMFPVYIRMEPVGSHHEWKLERVDITVNPLAEQIQYTGLAGRTDIWLGSGRGKILYLKRA